MVRTRGRLFLLLGLSLSTLAIWGLWRDIEWIAQPFYAYAWWGYIFTLDGFCALRRGHSLFTARYRHAFPICLWSITFWFFFELLNLRFQNWYYVGVFPSETALGFVGGGIFTILCFATVFTGLFETYEALTAAGLWRNWRGRPGRLPPGNLPRWVSYAVQGLGVAMVTAAILSPYYLAPLVWGSFTFLVDPWNYRRGARSILRDFEARDWGLVSRVFVAGLICGVVWESLNFFAPQKWIYTVRGLESFKLFEMPLLGFLGFPALAFDAMAAYALLASWFLADATWEHAGDLTRSYSLEGRRRLPSRVFWAAVPMQVGFWVLIASLIVDVNVGSVQLELEALSLSDREITALVSQGVRRPRQLVRVSRQPDQRSELAQRLGWRGKRAEEVLARAELMTFKGIGARFGTLLERLGIRRVRDLERWDPETLDARLREEAGALGWRPPRLDMVRVWILASRDGGVIMRHR